MAVNSNSISTTLTQIANNNNSIVNVLNNSMTRITDNSTTITNIANAASEGFMELGEIVSAIDLAKIGANAIGSFLTLGMNLESAKIKFESLLGSGEKANKVMADISQYASKTPYNNADLLQNAETLLKTGIAGDKVVDTLKMLGGVSGGNVANMQAMTASFAQMSSSGTLMSDQLSQMVSAGFDPLKVISETTGISLDKLHNKMAAGAISSGMVEEAFRLATGPAGEFNGVLDQLSQSTKVKADNAIESLKGGFASLSESTIVPLVGSLADMANQFFTSLGSMRETMQPFFDTLSPLWDAIMGLVDSIFGVGEATDETSGIFESINNVLSFLEPILSGVSNGIRAIILAITPFMPLIQGVAIAWGGLNLAFMLFNLLVNANPIGLIIGAVVVLVGVITTCWERFAGFRGVIMAAWEVLQGFGTMIYDYVINRFQELLTGITGIGQALMHFFNGDFAEAWEAGQNAANNLMGVGSATQLIQDAQNLGNQAGAAFNAEFANQQTPAVARGANKTKEKTEKVQPAKPSSVYDSLLKDNNPTTDKNNKSTSLPSNNLAGGASDGIIGGGAKATNITINLGKMQDQIVINTITAGEGASSMRQLLEEELNRLLGSVAAMQTT